MAKAGLELYSIKELMAKDVFSALKATAKAGFESVEFAGFFDKDAYELKDKLDELGLVVCGSHTGLGNFDDLDALFKINRIIGNKNIVLPGIPHEMCNSSQAWTGTAKVFTELGKKCRDAGFEFAYHNHASEFDLFDGVTGYQIMLDNVDLDYVKLQLDMGWVVFAGIDAIPFLTSMAPYLLNIHAKQIKSIDDSDGTELDRGYVDYKPIIERCIELNVDDIILEQESFDMDMLQSIKISCDYIKSFR